MKRIGVLFSILLLLVPLTAIAQDFCEGNFDYDLDVDGTDAFTFKTDFGRSGLIDPCPVNGPAPVPRTGLTLCYDSDGGAPIECTGTGQDGEYQKGVAAPNPRFTDNGNGTITDNLTGLIWLKNANCFSAITWVQALSSCNGLANGSCGLTDGSSAGDWRLPNYRELFSLVDIANYDPPLPTGHSFTNVQTSDYWTSSTGVFFDANSAFQVNMRYGYTSYSAKIGGNFVWPVRGGQ